MYHLWCEECLNWDAEADSQSAAETIALNHEANRHSEEHTVHFDDFEPSE